MIEGTIDSVNIIYYLAIFYVMVMLSLCGIYLYGIYNQYKNAHDRWYDIKRDQDKKDDKDEYLFNEID